MFKKLFNKINRIGKLETDYHHPDYDECFSLAVLSIVSDVCQVNDIGNEIKSLEKLQKCREWLKSVDDTKTISYYNKWLDYFENDLNRVLELREKYKNGLSLEEIQQFKEKQDRSEKLKKQIQQPPIGFL